MPDLINIRVCEHITLIVKHHLYGMYPSLSIFLCYHLYHIKRDIYRNNALTVIKCLSHRHYYGICLGIDIRLYKRQLSFVCNGFGVPGALCGNPFGVIRLPQRAVIILSVYISV